jgi:uncharacterized membrane protein
MAGGTDRRRRGIRTLRGLGLLGALLLGMGLTWAGRDDDVAAKAGVVPPTEWSFPAPKPLRVWAIHGLWYDRWALDRAFARLGGAVQTDAWHQPNWIRWYSPDTYEALMGHHLILVADINAHAFGNGNDPGPQRKRLKDYVANGGSILFLGGWFAYNDYAGTAFEEIAPVTFSGTRTPAPGGLPLALGPDALAGVTANWAAAPRVFWHYPVTPKAGAKVLVTADGHPLLIAGSYGKGRVAVFTGTLMGDPAPGLVPFWVWNGWPLVLAETITWLTAPSREGTGTVRAGDFGATLTAALAKTNGKAAAEQEVFRRLIWRCAGTDAARSYLEALAGTEWDLDAPLAETIVQTLLPYSDQRLAASAGVLAHAGKTHKTTLGLRVLGMSKAPTAKAVLLEALDKGAVAADEEEETAPEMLGEAGVDTAHLIRHAALDGLAALADPATLPQLTAVLAATGKGLPRVDEFPTAIPPAQELYQTAVLAAVRCGDATAAGPLIDQLLANRYIEINMKFGAVGDGKGAAAEARRAQAQRELARLQRRQQFAYGLLGTLPPAVLPAFAARLSTEREPLIAPIATAIFASPANQVDARVRAASAAELRKCPVPAVADLGEALQ